VRLAYLSFGSNVGDRGEHLALGVASVARDEPYRLSLVYETEPVGGVDQDDFWNLVMELTTDAVPRELLERAQRAEAQRGRTRELRWGPRTLDVDVLLVGSERSTDPQILVPHPRLYERSFVLVPLHELAPALVSQAQLDAGVGKVTPLGTLESLR
jgi:2-amino-4-hydroxy-6-hydroxymethyldihydropteridine diphosphokinase